MTLRKRLTAVLFASVALTSQVTAAEITPQGADQIKSDLNFFMPKDIVDTGFLKVSPDSGRYQIAFNLNALIEKFKTPSFTINGLTPLAVFAAPKDGGIWQVDSSWPVKVNGTFKEGDRTTNYDYAIGSYIFSGVFDQSVHYFTSGTTTAKDISMKTKEGETENSTVFKDMSSVMTGTKTSEGAVDMVSAMVMSSMTNTLTDTKTGPVEVTIDKIDGKANIFGAKLNEIMAILTFVLEHKDSQNLSDADAIKLKELLKAGLPFWNNLEESFDFKKIAVNTAMGSGTVDKIGIGFHLTGAINNASVGFSMSVENPVLPEGLFPPAYTTAIPTETFFDVSMPDFQASDAAIMLIDKFEFNKGGKPTSPEDDAALGAAFLGGDTMRVVLNKMTAKSPVYDLELTGNMDVNVKENDKVVATMTLLARDIDKTVDFLQKNAESVPEYGQAAFFAQMFKGFAVKHDDGRDKWVVEIAENNSVKINGTPFGVPK